MKRLLTTGIALCWGFFMIAQPSIDWDAAYAEADRIISTLTLDEKIDMTRGEMSFYFPEIPGKEIKYVYLSDATQGVNIRKGHHVGIRPLEKSTAFPCPVMLSATFNPALAYRYGKDVGEECSTANIRVLLGPGMNIYRDSQNGRNFEYFGEDPFHVGTMVSEYIKGLQSTGTAACAKHFVCNNIEWQRRNCNAIVDERTMHEIYLPHFKAAVDAGLAFVMTSYNLVNGEYTGQSSEVINGLLRHDLGFRGGVMTDWHSVWDYPKMILSGQNIEMPGKNSNLMRGMLDIAMRKGEITEADIENAIRPLIATCVAFNLYDPHASNPALIETFPQHEIDSYEVASEGVVLLKNNGILPLRKGGNILVTGRFIDEMPRGKGSGNVPGYNNVSLRDALTEAFGVDVQFVPDATEEQIAAARVVICSAGTLDAEDIERPFALPDADHEAVLKAIRNNPNTILLMNTGSGVRMTDYMDAAAIIYGWYPGQAGMRAVADVISGKVNPSGKMPFSIEREFSDSPSFGDIPEYIHKGAKVGDKNINEFHTKIFDVEYDEGVFVGYRWFESKGIKPLFPYGYGLSYTSFEISRPSARKGVVTSSQPFRFSVKVRNTGSRGGKEVVQLYVGESNPSVPRPAKELKAFRKVDVPKGKTVDVEFEISAKDLAFWDVESHDWKVNPGSYSIYVGNSSDNISLIIPVEYK